MNVCDNMGDHLVGNVYVKVSCLLASTRVVYNNYIQHSVIRTLSAQLLKILLPNENKSDPD